MHRTLGTNSAFNRSTGSPFRSRDNAAVVGLLSEVYESAVAFMAKSASAR